MAFWQAFFFSAPGLVFVAFYGAATGSFLNVVAYRLPRGISTVTPRSRCPRCAAAIRPWHNLPVFGWLLLGGRCRDCRGKISPRYPLVEAVTGALFVFSFLQQPDFWRALLSCAIAAWTLVLALIDFDLHVLPDSLTLPALAAGLGMAAFTGSFPERLATALAVYIGLGVLAAGWRWKFREEGLGSGDLRFAAALGAFFGGETLLQILLAAAAIALLMALLPHPKSPDRSQPLGTALGLVTLVYLLAFSPPLWP